MIADIRPAIQEKLAAFTAASVADPATALFDELGYHSDRRLKFASVEVFLAEFDRDHRISDLVAACPGPVLIQQLTSEEIAANCAGQLQLGHRSDQDVRTGMQRNFESYLFLALTLPQPGYSRSQLAELARRLNILFPQPVLVLFRYGSCISLAITYRRTSKRSADRDVVGRKVTLIKDISCERPHPGHGLAHLLQIGADRPVRFRGRIIKRK